MKREEQLKEIIDMCCEHFVTIPSKCKWRLAKEIDNYLATQPQEPAEVTDEEIKTEMDNYFKKLQRNPLPDIERFRIEMAFEYAAKWAREQMKNR